MKVGERANGLWLVLYDHTALGLGRFQVIQALEVTVGHAFVTQRPQPLTRL